MILLLHFDGLCEPKNPGGVAVGAFVLFGTGGEELLKGGKVVAEGDGATNNVAEWCALGFGLKAVREKFDPSVSLLMIRGDSQLVVNQLTGKFQVKAEHLRKYRDRCRELLEGLEWESEWVPREQNEAADAVGREIYQRHLATKKAAR